MLNRPVSCQQPVLFSRTDLPLAYAYLLSHIAKSLLHQAQNEVLAKAEAAFPLAKLVIGIMLRGHAALGEFLIARFVKKCPWVVSYYPAKQPGQTDEEYHILLGHSKRSDSTAEDNVQYNNRMTAILTLYLAICAVDIPQLLPTVFPQLPSPTTHPSDLQKCLEVLIQANFRTSMLWMWTAGILKGPFPSLETTPQLLVAAFETCGPELVNAYGTKQVGKLVRAINDQGLGPEDAAEGEQGNEGVLAPKAKASRQQLRLVCEPFLTTGVFSDNPAKQWKT